MYHGEESDWDERDSTCPHCGGPLYFEVGMGPSKCRRCGGLDSDPVDRERQDKDPEIGFG